LKTIREHQRSLKSCIFSALQIRRYRRRQNLARRNCSDVRCEGYEIGEQNTGNKS
jgi:hypothetical protein